MIAWRAFVCIFVCTIASCASEQSEPVAQKPLELRHVETGAVVPVPSELASIIERGWGGPDVETPDYVAWHSGRPEDAVLVLSYGGRNQPPSHLPTSEQCINMEIAVTLKPSMPYAGDTPDECRRKKKGRADRIAQEEARERSRLAEIQRQSDESEARNAAIREENRARVDALWFAVEGPPNPAFADQAGKEVRALVCRAITQGGRFALTAFDALGTRPSYETGQSYEMLTLYGTDHRSGRIGKISLHCVFDTNGRLHSIRVLDGDRRSAGLADEGHVRRYELPVYQQFGLDLPPKA